MSSLFRHFVRILVCVTCLSIGLAISQSCTATVFTDSVFLSPDLYPPPGIQHGFEIQAWTQPSGGGDGGFVWASVDDNLTLSPYAYTAGIGERWFSVGYGAVFDHAALSTATPFANNLTAPFTPGQMQLSVGQDFYLAFWLDSSPSPYTYGWAHLKLTSPTSLTLLGSAIENSGSGIVVGTTTVVPEPSSFCLTALALTLVFPFWRRR
ncbi:MAG TPA: PEP-CTERM sorting domain-containing protein [Verrucomicrobiae bacterium]|nr:PEP-CTERM sorting domain-containing protein [Verrucomicrobiae bacterium]